MVRLSLPELKKKSPNLSELSATGMTYGYLGRLAQIDYIPELTGIRGVQIYDRMRLSDPKVAGIRTALDLPIIQANWFIEPYSGEDRAIEMANFVANCLFVEAEQEWSAFLHEALLYLDYGHAVFEKVWKNEDGKIKLKYFGFIPQRTIQDIFVQKREVTKIGQFTNEKGYKEISGEKLLWFVNNKEGDNFRGWPILRPMYKPWYNKERAEILVLILAERMGGWLKFKQPVGASPEDKTTANTIGANFRMNEQMYMSLPFGWDATVETSSTTFLADLMDFIKYNDEQLANVAIAQVLNLGSTETGSRALGRTLGDMFTDSIKSRIAYLEEVFNDRQGPIAELCRYNFPDADEYMPKLKAGRADKMDIKTLAVALKTLSDMGMRFGPNTYRWIRQEAELPSENSLDVEEPEEPITPDVPGEASGQSPIPGQGNEAGDIWEAQNRGDGDRVDEYNPTPGEVDEEPF
jgi:hypothetical protein